MHDHGHVHAHDPAGGDRRLIGAVLINVLLTVVQVAGGLLSGSLALIADALHNLSDAGALVVALVARRIARRPADQVRTFGYRRAEVVGALVNLTALVLVGLYLVYEAISRTLDPRPVEGWIVVWIGALALLIDVATAVLTYRLAKQSLNVRAAFLHNVSDALGSVAVVVAGALILLFDWYWTDPLATVLISAWVLYHGLSMMASAVRILMEGVPPDVRLEEVSALLEAVPGVEGAHHLHVWQLDEGHRALEAHLALAEEAVDFARIKAEARRGVLERFGIGHCTFELEHPGEECADDDPRPHCF